MINDKILSTLLAWKEPMAQTLAQQWKTPRMRWLLHVAEHGLPREIADFKKVRIP